MHSFTLLTMYRTKKVFSDLKHLEKRLALLERYVSPGKLFDIGANGGGFLFVARKKGWHIEGNEISLSAVRWAKKYMGIKLHWGYFVNCKLKNESYDAIVMTNVLEHTHDPYKVLRKTYRALKPGGVTMVLIPIKDRKQIRKYYEPFHLFEFEKEGLYKMMDAIGFKKLYERKHPSTIQTTMFIYQKEGR